MHSVALEAQMKANEVGAIQQLNKTLYLGNIAPTVTDEELKTLFGCMVRIHFRCPVRQSPRVRSSLEMENCAGHGD